MKKQLAVALVVALCTVAAFAQTAPAPKAETIKEGDKTYKISPLVENPAYETLKKLAGDWDGTSPGTEGKSKMNFRLMAAGSAIVITMDQGTPHEMITVIHPDGKTLMATHYCAARNQPRMRLTTVTDPNVLRFDFVDVTNVPTPEAGHMKALVITIMDANHHAQDWTWTQNGKDSTHHFEAKRSGGAVASK